MCYVIAMYKFMYKTTTRTNKQTDKQTNKQTKKQRNKEINKQKNKHGPDKSTDNVVTLNLNYLRHPQYLINLYLRL